MFAIARYCAGAVLVLTTGAVLAVGPPVSANVKNGAIVYERCVACHALAYDRTGPRHCGLIGRTAGTVRGFEYSDAMKKSKIVWTAKTLDKFLANPFAALPGTSMGYAGVTDAKERSDLIAYLREANNTDECKKAAR